MDIFLFIIEIIGLIWYDKTMTKKRTNRKANDKKRRNLWIIVGLLFFTILTLGAGIAYKVLTKQAFEQKIEALKKEKDDAY